MPNFPRTTSWLSEEERQMATWRLEKDIGEDDWTSSSEQAFFRGAKLAAKDPKAWLLLATIYGFTSCGTVTTMFPSVVKGLGSNNFSILLLTAPPYIIGVIAILINAWHADRTGERYYHIALPPVLGLAAFVIAAATTGFGPQYFAKCLMIGANYCDYVVALAWISNILPRPPAKRAAALAGINALSNVCQIYSPFMYQGLRFVLVRLNKKIERDIEYLATASDAEKQKAVEEHGLPGKAVDRGFKFLI